MRKNLRNSPTRRSLLGVLGAAAAGAALTSCGVPGAYVAPEGRSRRDESAPDDAMRRRLVIARDITSAERREFGKRWNAIAGL
ncbi:hypothetical protein [Streptomyces sp. NPDC058374]|uniref:hypothetical protein n=1 Tax=Streptomyces sp. NPDC058374 TaxID=3346466 RepID=UPI00364BEE8C